MIDVHDMCSHASWFSASCALRSSGNAELETDQEKLTAMVEQAFCTVADIDAVNIKEAWCASLRRAS